MNRQQIEWLRMSDRIGVLLAQTRALQAAIRSETERPDSPYGCPGASLSVALWDLDPIIKRLDSARTEALARSSEHGPYSDAMLAASNV